MSRRPKLNSNFPWQDLRQYYWLKKELQVFAKTLSIPVSGEKLELLNRIETYLKDGSTVVTPKKTSSKVRLRVLTLETKIPEGFQCDRRARDFFFQHLGPSFRYSVSFQRFLKSNPGITFQAAMNTWKSQFSQKAKGAAQSSIGPQFEYNQFTRDYFADPANQGKSRGSCLEAWNRIRNQKGSRKYQPKL